ncbi:unnamed protein product [Rotaria sp. Silwood1]|nr:unnamed protein product [Rotaria sp. Silwood1]CAF0740893.1 unnamed protein product [Rotaria sp. Silwood1]CAF0796181.1 unnamed protein product [Rotaria sp. Silwood1]CAF3335446.1 unnamed protein product [Rotaria sp. Silwood1]CAF3349892.1 unnamed protein product [Rotaria sp. Silwood1]
MFFVDLNEQLSLIQVKTNDGTNSTIVAEGNFAFDKPDRTVLIIFKYVTITSDNHQQLDQFLSIVISYVGKLFKSLICLRLPTIFDNRIDIDKLEYKNKNLHFMSVTFKDLKYYPDSDMKNKQEQYELITDKQLILNYAEPLVKMMNREGFWCTQWNCTDMQNRINSATYNAMILDKINKHPCGFGRLFLLTMNNEIFGYLSDIVVDSSHQSKGLGRLIVNYLVGMSVNQNDKQQTVHGTLCLKCAYKGSGAISAPKLYQRSGFEFITDIGNRIAIFANEQNFIGTVE